MNTPPDLTLYNELVRELERCTEELWEALGGGDDEQNRDRADRACKRYRRVIDKARRVLP